jgi:Cu/Ag efflux pump CusA
VSPGEIRRATATLLASEEVGDIFGGGKAYDVHVWTVPGERDSLDDLARLPIDTPKGVVPLERLADIEIVPVPNVIQHESQSRSLDVGANIDDTRDLGSVVEEFTSKLGQVDFPLGYHAEILGEYAERQAAQQRLLGFAAITVLGIFLILMVSLGNFRLAALAFVTMPMALVGGLVAAYWTGGVISLGSLVGFFTVLGIVARNGIMMISHYKHLEEFEGEAFGRDLVLRGSQERISPITMTALTTGLALVPLIISGNIPGQEIEYPMAIVILGGLVTSTLLNLFVVPSLYLRFGKPRAEADPTTKLLAPA